ncbi:FtsX-like permease family protein [Romboutsia sedimentorum]|uniref:ABC transporter permease n=1 Tax=Romboutsia sedimentorum TaxID=1368474 RepID=UPI0024DE555E|nr:ABC transporter permease [Romboutsia sedimentorum]MDK2584395.1 FtsX-like permease family protein [Romboutsia sedimentorum]
MRKKLNLGFRYIKAYKKRSIAIILSMVLSIGLIVGLGTLSRTNDYAELQKMKYNNGMYHVEINKVDKDQVEKIKQNKNIENFGIYSMYKITSKEENQIVGIAKANEDYIKNNSRITEGRFPKQSNEIIGEVWVLRNLGIEPKINEEINLKIDDRNGGYKEEKFKLVGIMSDRLEAKSMSTMELFSPISLDKSSIVQAKIAFKEGSDINSEINKITKNANIDKEQIKSMDDLIDIETMTTNVDLQSVKLLVLISLVCGIVIYGIFNISVYIRVSEYGILRAVGSNNLKIFKIILDELFTLFMISVPIGLITGLSGALIFGKIADKVKTTVVLNGEVIKIGIKFPVEIILGSIISIALIVLIISYLTYRKIKKLSVIDSIKKNLNSNSIKRSFISIKSLRKFMKTYKAISFKNIFRNKKSFVMIVLSMSICGVLLITSNYRSYLSQADDFLSERAMNMNSDFMIDVFNEDMNKGINKKSLDEISNIDGVKNLETSQILYSRMIMDKNDILNQKYFDLINKGSRGEGLFKGYLVEDKKTKELILKNNLRGYDDRALEKLNDYIDNGEINIEKMKKENLAAVYVPKANKDNMQTVGGENVVDIKVGDTVKVKFRENKVFNESYYTMEDTDSKYIYKEFKVGAVVNYDYMSEIYHTGQDCVDIIVSQDIFKKNTGINEFNAVNVNMDEGAYHEVLEQKISKVTSKVKGAMLRDIVAEKENSNAMYEKSRIYNMGITFILFIITLVNVVNNISHSIMSRSSEFGMLRAVGLNNKDFNKMIIFEGLLYGIVSSVVVVIVSLIMQVITYNNFESADFGIKFAIRYIDYIIVIFVNLIIGVLATYIPAKKLNNSSIVESINIID